MTRLAACALVLLGGCSTLPPRVGEPPAQVADSQAEQAYHQVFDRWTRQTTIYDQLDNRMFLAATLQSPEFVKARVERLAAFEALPSADEQSLLQSQSADAAQGYDFFFGVHTEKRRWNDLDRNPSLWRVALHTSAGEVTPVLVERIQRPNVNLRGIYVYLGDFWVGYRVRFPAALPDGRPLVGPGETQLVLKLDSALGHAHLDFATYGLAVGAR
jgi:hypothetical protein